MFDPQTVVAADALVFVHKRAGTKLQMPLVLLDNLPCQQLKRGHNYLAHCVSHRVTMAGVLCDPGLGMHAHM